MSRAKSSPVSSAPPFLKRSASARAWTFGVLNEVLATSQFAHQVWEQWSPQCPLDDRDRRLVWELIHGVGRRRRTLETILAAVVTRPLDRIEPELKTLALLGIYQLVFLSSIPAHAAVHETVELARAYGQPRWCGFLNGILRGVQRMLTDDESAAPAANAVPIGDAAYRVLTKPVFPEPQRDPNGYLAAAFGLPVWLVERWKSVADFAELVRWGFWFNAPALLTLRVNRLRSNREQVLQEFESAGVAAEPGEYDEIIRLRESASVVELPGFGDGWWTVQDETAFQACRLLAPQPGESVLDLCAAPGTKSTCLAEMMHDEGSILATDVADVRLNSVTQNARRLGLKIIETKVVSDVMKSHRRFIDQFAGRRFDAVLVDAPCSNTGVIGKRLEVRDRLEPKDITELAEIQFQLLSAAIELVRTGGRVVYSTCSIEPEENRQVVDRALQAHGDVTLVNDQLFLPSRPADGGYSALING
ncbi:MAG: transcription antitermination factor NusB [Planctomycetaceae bacterium]